jgi:hypothetical protein
MVERPFAGSLRMTAMIVLVLVGAVALFGQFDVATLKTRPAKPISETGSLSSATMAGVEETPGGEAEQ